MTIDPKTKDALLQRATKKGFALTQARFSNIDGEVEDTELALSAMIDINGKIAGYSAIF